MICLVYLKLLGFNLTITVQDIDTAVRVSEGGDKSTLPSLPIFLIGVGCIWVSSLVIYEFDFYT